MVIFAAARGGAHGVAVHGGSGCFGGGTTTLWGCIEVLEDAWRRMLVRWRCTGGLLMVVLRPVVGLAVAACGGAVLTGRLAAKAWDGGWRW